MTWTATAQPRRCGSCGMTIAAGLPMRHLRGEYLQPRCLDCAWRLLGEAPPATLPVPEVVAPIPSALHDFVARVRAGGVIKGFDAKQKAAGDDAA